METEGSATTRLDLALVTLDGEGPELVYPAPAPRPGELCPKCQAARLDYDGLLNLTCPNCGYIAGGCFT